MNFYTIIIYILICRSWFDLGEMDAVTQTFFFPNGKQAILSLEMFRNQKQRDTSHVCIHHARRVSKDIDIYYLSSNRVHDQSITQEEEYATRQIHRFLIIARLHYCGHQPYLDRVGVLS